MLEPILRKLSDTDIFNCGIPSVDTYLNRMLLGHRLPRQKFKYQIYHDIWCGIGSMKLGHHTILIFTTDLIQYYQINDSWYSEIKRAIESRLYHLELLTIEKTSAEVTLFKYRRKVPHT